MENKPILTTATGMSRKVEVSWLQQRLKDKGYAIKVDGIFGTETDRVVREFQKANNIRVDGIVGKGTYAALEKDMPRMYPTVSCKPLLYNGGDTLLNRNNIIPTEKYSSEYLLGDYSKFTRLTQKVDAKDKAILDNDKDKWSSKIVDLFGSIIGTIKNGIDKIEAIQDLDTKVGYAVNKEYYSGYYKSTKYYGDAIGPRFSQVRKNTTKLVKGVVSKSEISKILFGMQNFCRGRVADYYSMIKTKIDEAKNLLKKLWKLINSKLKTNLWKNVKKFAKKIGKLFGKIPLPLVKIGAFLLAFSSVISAILDGDFEKALQEFCNALFDLLVDAIVVGVIVALFTCGLWLIALMLFVLLFVLDLIYGDKVDELINNIVSKIYNGLFVRS